MHSNLTDLSMAPLLCAKYPSRCFSIHNLPFYSLLTYVTRFIGNPLFSNIDEAIHSSVSIS